jgi:DNA polymerase-3 subunit beta
MKFTVSSTDFQRSLAKISGVVPSKSTLPILENILFDLKKSTLRAVATDLEVTMSIVIDVKGSEDGTVTIPARRLLDTLRSLPDVQLVVSVDPSSQKIKLLTESGEYTIMGESGEDFPAVPEFKAEQQNQLDLSLLKRIIGGTVFAASSDELRPAMTGMLLQVTDKEPRAVATDGHRLVRHTATGLKGLNTIDDIIIPSKALSLLAKSMDDAQGLMTTNATHVQFQFGSTILTSRLIEEKYPNYESVIPLDNAKLLTIAREDLLASARRVALYSSSTTHQIRFSMKGTELRVTAEDVDFGGEAREKLRCSYDGEEMEIGFNSTYVVDLLSHLDADDITFKFNNPVRAAVVGPSVQRTGEDILMLVMPVRLNA